MTSEVKNTAITAAGYFYQTMQGVNLLCDWMDSPTRYTRIRFECDEEETAPRGLDDLVAERPDGRVDLWQVKFTPSADKHALDWDWLFSKSGKSGGRARSNLRKWFDAFARIEPARVGGIRLLTNRVPDLAMEACLAGGNFIDYKRAPDDVRVLVEKELDTVANAERFFEALEVRHSDKGFSSLEAHVTDRLRRHGTPEGIATLKNRAVHWSIQKKQPAPDGWITLDLVQVTLQAVPPEPLPENFFIPPGYRVPDKAFYLTFIEAIKAVPREPIVLTGPPGRGKSTFLSKVCEFLRKKDIPFVRHHYYLSATDRSLDRHTSFVVQESLLAQINNFHREANVRDRTLRSALATCAAYYKDKGSPFVVMLDGLDHVWRNQGQDKRPLDEIFNQILPTEENLVLVVGTQPVDDAQLPLRLMVETPRSSWKELPAMSADAVLDYLRKELASGRLRIDRDGTQAEEELQGAATALRARTNGHPLHVIYATEEIVRSGDSLSKWSVERLVGDLSHDVRSYYGSLWQLLTDSQKDVLRLVCEFPFFWPSTAFTDIASAAGHPAPVVPAVEHLLHCSAAGLKPFHESLVVFVKQTDGYDKRTSELTPLVEEWLSKSAPNALRVNWLWAVRARQGRPDELINGLQRDWVLQRVQEGYPTELIEGLLDDAEEHALQRAQYADAYRLRHLKTRLLNSLSYTLSGADAARLMFCTWALAQDRSVVEEAVASRHETDTLDVAALGMALDARGDTVIARACAMEALQRHRGESRFSNRFGNFEAQSRVRYLVKALSRLGAIGTTPRWAADIVETANESVGRTLLDSFVEKQNLKMLVDVCVGLPLGGGKVFACDAAVRAAALAEADLTAWSEFPQLCCGVLAGCLGALVGKDCIAWIRPLEVDWGSVSYERFQGSLANFAHDWFFGALRVALLTDDTSFSLLKAPSFERRQNLADYLNRLGELALEVARRWRSREAVPFSSIYAGFQHLEVPDYRDYDRGRAAADFRHAMHRIAIDVHLLSSMFGQNPKVDSDELLRAMSLSWFDSTAFQKMYASVGVKTLADDSAVYFVREQRAALDHNINAETGVRMRAILELCEIALLHGSNTLATDLCSETWELALGYGERKDPALSDVLDALEYLQPVSPDATRMLLAEIAPQVHNVLAYTDGKGTRHLLAQADRLLGKLHRGALAEKHREHIEMGDWSHAEDSLQAYVMSSETSSAALRAVVRTGIHYDVMQSLQAGAANGGNLAAELLAQAEQQLGADVGQIVSSRPGGTGIDSKPFAGDVKTYPIEELSRLLDDLRELYGARRDTLCEWYAYWESQGKGSELIAVLQPKLLSASCRDDDLAVLLDMAFKTKLRLEGAAAAFPYIVQAQLYNGGWLGPVYMERSEVTEERLRWVVAKYRHRCDEFFLKSALDVYAKPRRSRIVPSDIMVFFLGLQGRTEDAIQFANAMVQS
ncbi:ATP-binding protein, partial [Burkholderia ubonensis]|uniref:ATP-binding protein n=1 Tax=Burkholderia ubonensis TaxID=101571 RepID=UPI0009B50AD5